jgi:hypothetical protein
LLGIGGRIGGSGDAQGSHPGPLAFYAMAPVHRALGDTAWALQVATAVVQVAALGAALWLVRRRGGRLLFLGAAAAVGLVVAACTAELLTLPWNPYIPLLSLLAFLVAVWSFTADDLVGLPVAAVAGSLCVQTHVPYTGVVGAGALVALAWAGFRLWRPPPAGPARVAVATTVAVTAGLALLLWLPPIVEQLTEESGNLAKVVDYFADPPEDTFGPRDGFHLLLLRLDPWKLLTNRTPDVPFAGGSSVPGAALLGVWAVAAVAAWRLRAWALLRLHAVLGVAVVAAGVAFSRILGPPFGYLSLWTYGIAVLVLLAIGWTAGLAVSRLLPTATVARLRPVATAVLAVAVLAGLASATVTAWSAESTEPGAGGVLAGVTRETVDALRAGDLRGTGEDVTYLLSSVDPVYGGAPMQGLVNELERAGLRAGSTSGSRVALGPSRVLDPGEATAEVHVAVGPAAAADRPGAVAVARFDPRDGPDGDRYEELRDEAARLLEEEGAGDLVEQLDRGTLVFNDPRASFFTRALLSELREIGAPAAVFVSPLD